jgi:hypothetical protein
MRRERDNVSTPEMRTAARDAEARRFLSAWQRRPRASAR